MRFIMGLCFAALLLASAYAEETDDALRVYAVNILRHPTQSWTGYGIYLGKGLIITAAHVVGEASTTKPSVLIAGLDLPARVIKEGTFEGNDLTLLSIDAQRLPINLQMRRAPLCETPPRVGEPVIVVVPEGTARSRIMSPRLLPKIYRAKFSTVISDVATTGNSGSGVFAEGQKCLLGIMSRKIQVGRRAEGKSGLKDIAKYFVPAVTIRAFIPDGYKF